jgi:hypothetical protein
MSNGARHHSTTFDLQEAYNAPSVVTQCFGGRAATIARTVNIVIRLDAYAATKSRPPEELSCSHWLRCNNDARASRDYCCIRLAYIRGGTAPRRHNT